MKHKCTDPNCALHGSEDDPTIRDDYDKWVDNAMKEFGFYIHWVPVNEAPHDGEHLQMNHHTHGLTETYPGSMDLQIVLPVHGKQAAAWFHDVVDSMYKKGKPLKRQGIYEKCFNVPVLARKYRESGRTVLRLIFPDEQGKWPWDADVHPAYAMQTVDFDKDDDDAENA